jgi:Protein of unknown function (DUF559)
MRSPRSSLNETPRNKGAPATSLSSADAITTATHRIVTHVAQPSPTPRTLRQPQFNINLHGYEVDVYWPQARLVLEFDGAATHDTTTAFHEDRRRDRALAAKGIHPIRVTWPDLGAELMREVKEILARR